LKFWRSGRFIPRAKNLIPYRGVVYIDMDMSYTKVLDLKVAYRVPHKWRHAFYVIRPLLCARITCYVTVIM
jgi:hypothetical protein